MLLDFIKNFFSDHSGADARNRLKVVIMQDRSSLTPDVMENLRKDMVKVFAKYLEMDESGIEFNLDAEDRGMGLSISIPIKQVRKEDAKRAKVSKPASKNNKVK